jgi:integrase
MDAINPEQALRHNEGKPQWHLVHFPSLIPLVKVLEYGAQKYAPNNWKKGAPREQYLDCAMRHLAELMEGKEMDEESKQHHMGHVMANAMMYVYHYDAINTKNELKANPVQ